MKLLPVPENTAGAVALQKMLACRIISRGDLISPGLIAGADVSVNRFGKIGWAAVVVLNYPGLDIEDAVVVEREVTFPYVPGLLSFRELPLIVSAFEKLRIKPDLVIMDGQGIAHPRRLGLAAHLGLVIETPVIGCAKSRLCGEYREPGTIKGDSEPLIYKGETVGTVLRTRDGVRPVFVSPGHRIGINSASKWVLNTCRGYRLPEPIRQAHLAAGRHRIEYNIGNPPVRRT
ncbi:MAG: deoxyribonuclease V [Dehalococcoidaceae bacterium]|nr:deoxyribonuclease V [Dehalococcoidaceae bacterium]